jgi:hypothetical protein
VAKYLDRTADDREPDAQAVAAFGRKTREGFEDSRQLVFRNPDPRVVYIDPDFGTFAATADLNPPSRLRVPCGVGQQILEDAIEQYRIAHYMGIRCDRPKIDACLKSGIFVFVSEPPEQWPKSDGRDLQRIGAFGQVKGIHQAIELFGQFCDGPLSPVQPGLLRHLLQARAQQRICPLNDLQGLPEVMSHHPDNRRLKLLRDESFWLPILHVRRGDEAFYRSQVSPCWLSMAQFHQKPLDGIFAIVRFGAADQLVV